MFYYFVLSFFFYFRNWNLVRTTLESNLYLYIGYIFFSDKMSHFDLQQNINRFHKISQFRVRPTFKSRLQQFYESVISQHLLDNTIPMLFLTQTTNSLFSIEVALRFIFSVQKRLSAFLLTPCYANKKIHILFNTF